MVFKITPKGIILLYNKYELVEIPIYIAIMFFLFNFDLHDSYFLYFNTTFTKKKNNHNNAFYEYTQKNFA